LECNGAELCDIYGGCLPGTDGCGNVMVCLDSDDLPVGTSPLALTLNLDFLTLSVCDDVLPANVALANGMQTPTLQTGDSIDDLGGNDLLFATLVGVGGTIRPTINGVETIALTDFGTSSTTYDAIMTSGLGELWLINGIKSFPVVVTNLATLPVIRLQRQAGGVTLNLLSGVAAEAKDVLALMLNGNVAGNVVINTADGATIEAVVIVSLTSPSALGNIVLPSATVPPMVTISGDATLTLTGTIDTADFAATELSAALIMSASTATRTSGVSIFSGSGNDVLFGSAGADTINGGAGNDRINGQGANDTLTGGIGADTFVLSAPSSGGSETITDFAPAEDFVAYTGALRSTDGTITTPGAPVAFQEGVPNTGIAATTTVFELIGATVAVQASADVVMALGITAINDDIDVADTLLLVVYTAGSGAGVWLFVDADGANISSGELTLLAALPGVLPDTLSGANFP